MECIACFFINEDTDEHLIFEMALEATVKNAGCRYYSYCDQVIDFFAGNAFSKPDYIFLDLNPSDYDFEDDLRSIIALKGYSDFKIIVFTGHIAVSQIDHLIKLGASLVLERNWSVPGLTRDLNLIFSD